MQHVTKWGAICYIAYLAKESIVALAGNSTVVDVALNFLLDTAPGNTVTVSVSFGVVAVFYGLAERRLRERRTHQMGSRITELESKIDPHRSSSGLDPMGKPLARDAWD